jgi:hypothetical protein
MIITITEPVAQQETAGSLVPVAQQVSVAQPGPVVKLGWQVQVADSAKPPRQQ